MSASPKNAERRISLTKFLDGIEVSKKIGPAPAFITSITFDSREVTPGAAFVAVRGEKHDGHTFIDAVIKKGATLIVCENLPASVSEKIHYVVVPDTKKILGLLAGNFYGHPSRKLKLVGITGTNGKTTTVTLLHELFQKLGYTAGLLSTIENKIGNDRYDTSYTTPDAIALQKMLAEMVEKGVTHCFMEASSHAIEQHRVRGLRFAGGIFSNLTQDHLDYHKTLEEYARVKKSFFDWLPYDAFAIANIDDERGQWMIGNALARRNTYSYKEKADFEGQVLSNTIAGLSLKIGELSGNFKLIGLFNAYNILAVYGAAVLLGQNKEKVFQILQACHPVRGRFECVTGKNGVTAVIDYAHTPDAVKNVLSTAKEVKPTEGRIITVLGCGGNRDKTKRPIMAHLAVSMSDVVFLTSDNPRTEVPEAILADMEAGLSKVELTKTKTIVDRTLAIHEALSLAKAGDIVVIAGKGHETYQEVHGVKHHFDDIEVVREWFGKRS